MYLLLADELLVHGFYLNRFTGIFEFRETA